MAEHPDFDREQAHRQFSAGCFNRAWEFLDQKQRTPEDDERMIHVAHASLWHWMQRPDCSNTNLSIGYWQLARIYALLGEAENARKYARICLNITPPENPFCLGYAHEALARAETLAGNADQASEHLVAARQHLEEIRDPEDKQLLSNDLEALQSSRPT